MLIQAIVDLPLRTPPVPSRVVEFRHDPTVNLSDACLRYNSLDLDDDHYGCLFKGESIDGAYDLLTLRSKIASLKQGLSVSQWEGKVK